MEEMPAEEGFRIPASRIAEFYERAGMMEVLEGGDGSVSIIEQYLLREVTSPNL